jgi:hypothetical protein
MMPDPTIREPDRITIRSTDPDVFRLFEKRSKTGELINVFGQKWFLESFDYPYALPSGAFKFEAVLCRIVEYEVEITT